MSGVPALTKAAANLLCVVCCFNTPKLNSNGEEKKDGFLMPVQRFVIVLCYSRIGSLFGHFTVKLGKKQSKQFTA